MTRARGVWRAATIIGALPPDTAWVLTATHDESVVLNIYAPPAEWDTMARTLKLGEVHDRLAGQYLTFQWGTLTVSFEKEQP